MKRFLSVFLPLLFATANLFAQDSSNHDAAAGFMGFGCGCLFFIIAFAIQIAIAIWVYKDAKSRGMENALLLTILTVFTGVLGLIIYLLMRPKNKIMPPAGPQPPL